MKSVRPASDCRIAARILRVNGEQAASHRHSITTSAS
jgi:hypothetical protein